jgi:hypothetical protein
LGSYDIESLDRPGLDGAAFDARYVIDLVRCHSERQQFISDFEMPDGFSLTNYNVDLQEPDIALCLQNVNELWFEVNNLFLNARLGFATARMFKLLEDAHTADTDLDRNARYNLHLDKMERFDLAAFEMSRIEDLVARAIYEFFGSGFLEDVDESKDGWEKRVTWDRMKDGLNRRGRTDTTPHVRLASMADGDYQKLISAVREYRSRDVLSLVSYRDRRTHRTAPTVDHAALGTTVQTRHMSCDGPTMTMFLGRLEPEFQFEQLYSIARKVYTHLLSMVRRVNEVIHA